MEKKQCNTCFEVKILAEFHKDKGKSDGHKNYCKACYKRSSYNYVKKGYNHNSIHHKGAIKPRNEITTLIVNGIEFKGKICTSCNTWRNVKQYHKFSRMSDGLEIYCKKCRKEHLATYHNTERGKEVAYKAAAKRRARMKGVKFTEHMRKQILERDKYLCQKCGIKVHDRRTGNWNTPDKAHLDHIISLEDGGDTTPENLQTLCRSCNLSKGSKSEGEAQLVFF